MRLGCGPHCNARPRRSRSGRVAEAIRLEAALSGARADVDVRLVVMHYSPTTTTLGREPIVKYWMLGNVELARVIDRHQVDLVIHGHAHLGNPSGHDHRGHAGSQCRHPGHRKADRLRSRPGIDTRGPREWPGDGRTGDRPALASTR